MYNYVDSANLNSNLLCCICHLPFTEPTSARTCTHTFCKDCIHRALEHSPQCPIDRSPLVPDDLAPANPIVRSLVDELMVECVHNAEGCEYTCQRQLLSAHLLNSCTYRQVPCPQGKCEAAIRYRDISHHFHEGGDAIDPKNSQTSGEQSDILGSGVSKAVQAQLCACTDSSPQGPTSDADRRLATLSEQNILLRHKVQGLETLVQGFQRDMLAIKRALGPWYQVGERGGIGSYLPANVSLDRQSSSVAATVNTGAPSPPDPSSPDYFAQYQNRSPLSSTSSSANNLALYFPPEVMGAPLQSHPVPPAVRRNRSLSSAELLGSSQTDHYPYVPYQAPVHAPLVAPLNLGTTLEGTLHGLRESVVGLATSVDSMGRRHEIALTHETLRMAEEIGGLRAGIHGLRMQVHSIMMDRNSHMTGRDGVGEVNTAGQWMPLPAPPPLLPVPVQTRLNHLPQPSITKL